MEQYHYTQDDFNNPAYINTQVLQSQVTNSGITSANFVYISTEWANQENFVVDFYFDAALSPEDIVILDEVVFNYVFVDNIETICFIKDVKDVGTNGGTFEQDEWRTRDLNVLIGNVSFVSLTDNIITFEEDGRYLITVRCPAVDVQNHQMRLYDVTNDISIMGTNAFSSNRQMSTSDLTTISVIEASTTFEVQHIGAVTCESIGFGKAVGFDSEEIYTTVSIQKIDVS